LIVGDIILAVVSIPLILNIIPRNSLYGFRTPSTLSGDEIWFRANYFAGWALFIAAVAGTMLLLTVSGSAMSNTGCDVALFALPLIIAVVASFVNLRRINQEREG
jgi:hypothetical protein